MNSCSSSIVSPIGEKRERICSLHNKKRRKIIRCTYELRDWLQLPGDLIGDIAKRISHIEDFVSFGSVCKAWHSVTLDKNCRSGIRDLPWLMFPGKVKTDRDTFYSLSTKKTYYNRLPKILHELHSCLQVSPLGWLMVREYMNNEYRTNLLNPLTRVRIQLPSMEEPFFNAALSASPLSSTSHDNCIVMIINSYQDELLFSRPGDNSWTTLEEDVMCGHGYAFCSIVHFKCQFYALTYDSELWTCDVSIPRPRASKLTPDNVASPIIFCPLWLDASYLVEVGDELLLVHQQSNEIFELFKFDFTTKEWKKLTSLSDYAIFVGTKSSFALSALEYPGLKGGCIYFFDRRNVSDGKTGIYNFNEEKMSKPPHPKRKQYYDHNQPIWIKPSLK
ncbi:hypothetical protein GIB67_004924 [Kingdonia uniflora]|uniref:DUF295 domain-containing protein n=1 Tax=Kingdonia uniflora TaxID=39325 RepID=A0A7J7P7X5_9MAGN|nr:hypothetical protein GIB67_042265 [Kingdonia uniflora]KAF6175298.1 hypothetical protein GIB67_004924 [Kingdonia uniflora]